MNQCWPKKHCSREA